MRTFALILGLLVAAPLAVIGRPAPFSPPKWDDVRKHQPDGLQLKVILPKDRFYQGEVINAALEFSNTSPAQYYLWIGNYDRSGRIPDIAFHAQDAAGHEVGDPLAWYFTMGGMGGGLGNFQDLGTWTITLPVNQWLRFDRPGVYTLYAWSDRVQKGQDLPGNMNNQHVELVSDKVQVTIDPLTPATEQQVIAQAKGKIALGGDFVAPAVEQLRYLETPAARAELIPLLANDRMSFDAIMGLCAAPDPDEEAASILTAVSQNKLSFRPGISFLYSRLKTHDLLAKFTAIKPAQPEAQQFRQQFLAADKQARDEIEAAAIKASGGKGDSYIQTLLTKFQQNSHDPAVRAELAQHQLELSNEQANGLLEDWNYSGGEDFLPLARKMAAIPNYNLAAVMALMKSRPDEAHALLVADAKLPKSNIFTNNRGSFQYDRLHLAPSPVPELDSALRDKLNKPAGGQDLETTLFYINKFGSPALLPDVTAAYLPHEGKWACEIEKLFLQYWLRCDPKAGVAAMSRALQSRTTGCYKSLLEFVLTDQWNDAALPLLLQSLNDSDNEVALNALTVIQSHPNPSYADKAIAALARVHHSVPPNAPQPAYLIRLNACNLAGQLLNDPTWQFTPQQKEHLQAISKSD